jgi:DNA invertase Pin-like site-specific DNA recombinase
MSPRRQPERSLPVDVDQLRGLRAARWTRESTGKLDPASNNPIGSQWDAFGPDAQRAQQDRAIERLGLVDVAGTDSSLDFRLARSGRTVADDPEYQRMLSRAGVDFDVLVCAYNSRLARDLHTAVNTRHEMHSHGAVLYFADEGLLSSDERRWQEWADEAVEAEAYSRKMGRRIKEGLEAKRHRLGEPGGRPPYGFKREGRPPVLVEDPTTMPVLHRVFALAAEGLTDREVAERTGLKKKHIAELLTNTIYIGELKGGGRGRTPVIGREVWERVQAKRARHSHRAPGPVKYRPYLLSGLLRCRSCGHSITGHSGRYRAEVYDPVVHRALEKISLNADVAAAVADAIDSLPAPVNELALQRIHRLRRDADERLRQERDPSA